MASITETKKQYIIVAVTVILLAVLYLLVTRTDYVRCYLKPMCKETSYDGGIRMVSTEIYPGSNDGATLTPTPTPGPQVTWNGFEKVTRKNDMQYTTEKFSMSGKTWAVLGGFLLAVAVTLTAIAIALYYVIRSSQLNQTRALAVSGTALALILVLGIFGCFKFWQVVTTESYVEPDPEYRQWYIHAPIIYLYDEQCREATVKLDLDGELTCTYPAYDNGWIVKTSPDGTLTDANGRAYEYLFWEADLNMNPDITRGFCVKNTDTAAFLEKALSELGLSDTEANTFIMYWLPIMEENPYNVISFQTEAYENAAKLEVTPNPDTIVRVNMLFQASDEYVEIEEQDLSTMNPALIEREGFVLVEWGGEYVSSDNT